MDQINLSDLTSNVIDLSKYGTHIYLYNTYQGESLIIKNGREDQYLGCTYAKIVTKDNFAIKLLNCESFSLSATVRLDMIGGIQVIGNLPGSLTLTNLSLSHADVGLHMTQHNGTEQYGNINLLQCSFVDCYHEGVYIGNHQADDEKRAFPKAKTIKVSRCNFLRNHWDGGQFAHCETLYIEDSVFAYNGRGGKKWQDKDLILNPGVGRADVINSLIKGETQIYGTTKFFQR
jgi:hypothetical protein